MRLPRVMIVLGMVLGLFAAVSAGSAQAQAPATFTLAPGGTATITYEAFCTDFGKKFPTTLQQPNAVGTDAVRGAIAYIQTNNLGANPQQALEAQYGLWRATGTTTSPQGGDVANAVANAAQNPPANPQGVSLLDAVKNNQVRLTLGTWAPVGDQVQIGSATDNFYGRGTLTVENTSQQQLTLYMPVGTLFPPATAGEQTMAAYATKADVVNPQPTPQPTAAVATAQPTAAAATQPTAAAATQPTGAAGGQAQRPAQLPQTSGGTHTMMLLVAFGLVLLAGAVRLLRKVS